jgi:fructose-specific phosphotransferase system IIA component
MLYDWNVMILTQILKPDCIVAPPAGQDKNSVITELVDLLDKSGQLLDRDSVLQAVLAREQARSTGIGSGVAIPHGKCTGISELTMAIGIIKDGLEFDSIDEKPVTIVVLLASPSDRTGPHIQALARISRLMLDAEFKDKLENATSPEEVYELIDKKENE